MTQGLQFVPSPLSSIAVTPHELGAWSTESYLDEQLDLTARFNTGFLKHTLITGIEGGKETSDPTRPTWTNLATTPLLNPDPTRPLVGTSTITSVVHTTSLSVAAYLLDTIQLGKHWDLTGGIRWDRFDTAYTQGVAPVSAFNRLDAMPTWRGAIVYKPVSIGSVYFDAGTIYRQLGMG